MNGNVPIIKTKALTKTFRAAQPIPGLRASFANFFRPEYSQTEAVKDVSFEIYEGERVAFIGPNGAGKFTTIKMLTGILYPTSGSASVFGYTPWTQREDLSFKLGCVFGQRSQLWFHLSALESFHLLGKIFRVSDAALAKQLDDLVDVFDLRPLLAKRASQMSLGERMRCEVAASLIHSPQLVVLDEPSIGLDVVARISLRDFIRDFSKRKRVTVLLTSHDTGDIEGVCDRVILINKGGIVMDQSLSDMKALYLKRKNVTIHTVEAEVTCPHPNIIPVTRAPHQATFEVDPEKLSIEEAISILLKSNKITDLNIEDPPLEKIVAHLYHSI